MIYPIVKFPDPVLARKAEPVTVFDADLARLTDDMFESMYAAEGIGLAAPQIGVSKRIFIVDTSLGKNQDERLVLINPEIVDREGKQTEEEGCLSLPDIRDKVNRSYRVKMRAQDVDGKWFEIEGDELLARAFQHGERSSRRHPVYRSAFAAEARPDAAQDSQAAEERRMVVWDPSLRSSS